MFLCLGIRNFGIVIFWLGGKVCIVKIGKGIVFTESRYFNSKPEIESYKLQVSFFYELAESFLKIQEIWKFHSCFGAEKSEFPDIPENWLSKKKKIKGKKRQIKKRIKEKKF